MYKINLLLNQTHYVVPKGENLPYFSFTNVAKKAVDGVYSDNPIIRHASIANKWKTIHLIMYPGINATVIHFNITFNDQNDKVLKMQIFIDVDTAEDQKRNNTRPIQDQKEAVVTTPTPEAEILFENIPEEERFPKLKKQKPDEYDNLCVHIPYVNVSSLPNKVQLALHNLDLQLSNGDITLKGYNLSKTALLEPFVTLSPHSKDDLNVQKPIKQATIPKNQSMSENNANPQKARFDSEQDNDERSVKSESKLNRMEGQGSKLLKGVNHLGTLARNREDNIVPGRKLQFQPNYEGFLPWEKKKYFKDLLDVSISFLA